MRKLIDQKRYGIILGYLIIVAEGLSGLLFTPILLGALGNDEYGLYKLALSWMSIVSTLDFGLGGTITRFVVRYRVEKDRDGEKNFLGLAYSIYLGRGALILIIGAILCVALPLISKSVLPENASEFRLLLIILTGKTAVLLFNHAYSGRFVAYEKFIFIKSMSLMMIVVRIFAVILLLQIIPSAVTVVVVDFVLTLLQLLCNVLMTLKSNLPRISFFYWNARLFKEIVGFTVSIFVISVINQFNGNVDSIVLGIYSTTAMIGLYASVMQIYTIYCSLSTSIQDVFMPSVSRSVFENRSSDEITMSIVRPSRMQLIVLMLAFSGFVLFGEDFLTLWIGKNYTPEMIQSAYFIGLLVLSTATWHLFQNSATSILKAMNKLGGRVILIAASTGVNLLLTVFLTPRIGMMGAAIGTAFSLVFGFGLATNIYYSKVIHLNLKLYYCCVFRRVWIGFLAAFGVGMLIRWIPLGGVIGFCVKAVLFVVCYCGCILFVGLEKAERNGLLQSVPCIRKRHL